MMEAARPRLRRPAPPPEDERPWTTLSDAVKPAASSYPTALSRRNVLAIVIGGAVAVLLIVAVSGSIAAQRLAAKESVYDAARSTGVLADAVVQPALQDDLVSGDREAFTAIDHAVREHVLGPAIIRVKIWTPDGEIVYSDEPELIGKVYPLGAEEREVFTHPATRGEVSDLSRPENVFERGKGKLLEVYRPVWTPSGDPLLLEVYAPYDGVTARAGQLWRAFAGITVSSLLALVALMLPLIWRMLSRLRDAQEQRALLLERAVQASNDERRRIAGTLHDGVIQDLAGASYVVSSAAARSAAASEPDLATDLRGAADTVRRGISGMRTLLVDIYPPSLATSGLLAALEDRVTSLGARDIDVLMDLDPGAVRHLSPAQERLFYRVAHECLLNTIRHARARQVTVSLRADQDAAVLEISDDGVGFDAGAAVTDPAHGQFGMRVLADLAREAGAELYVASAPGAGTRWLLRA
jgi:two-component system, NarL family, sensor kinase